jgi:deazaflavin-dependent oxidoreductase (nitroreductase family)
MSTTRPPSRLAAVGAGSDLDLSGSRRTAAGLAAADARTHRRKSGLGRYVVLEVVDHPTPDSYVVASGFGEKAQWFRNVKANPRMRVYTTGAGLYQ